MKILLATPEAVPYAKTGGLADVTGALFKEYRSMKKDVYLILPLYARIKERFRLRKTGKSLNIKMGSSTFRGNILFEDMPDRKCVFFIECDKFYSRKELYGTPDGGYTDNALRFIFFSRAILDTCRALDLKPDVIHCHDWQTGLVPLYLKTIYATDKYFSETVAVHTIHNLGYQGLFDASDLPLTGLGWEMFTPEGIEFYGKVNFLKAALISADVLTTVSKTYAKEILNKENGFGLDGVLRKRQHDLYGIGNGIDYEVWNPSHDNFIPKKFNKKDLQGKYECKKKLVKICSLDKKERPIIGMIGRLSSQKGLDILLDSIDELIRLGVNIVLLGMGDKVFHTAVLGFAKKYQGRVYVNIGFEEGLAHMIYAGSDFLLIPSRYEPCGLSQLIAMRYGSVPIARATGGLADTIRDYDLMSSKGTGFLFSDYTKSALQDAVKRALCVYSYKDRMEKLILNCMKMDFSWKDSARMYIELYKNIHKKVRG